MLSSLSSENLKVGCEVKPAIYFHKPEEPYGFLSNWWLSDFVLDGVKFTSNEQYIMYRKCVFFGDMTAAKAVMKTDNPAQQQAIAKNAIGYNDVMWNGTRQLAAYRGLMAKFEQNVYLAAELLSTGDAVLVECARTDHLWACGVSLYDDARHDIDTWAGKNILGFALMEVRDTLRTNLALHQIEAKSEIRCEICDITKLHCDCIVNAANKSLLGGGGVDGAIHRAAGPELLKECQTLNGCNTGEAKITKGYNLPAKYIIHTVGPVYSGKQIDADMLLCCYINSLGLAKKYDIHSIAFPAISTGVYGYPLDEACKLAIQAITAWFNGNLDYDMTVTLSCFDERTLAAYKKILP